MQQWELWKSLARASPWRKSTLLPAGRGAREVPEPCGAAPARQHPYSGQNKDILVHKDLGRITWPDPISPSELRGWRQLCLQWIAEQIIIETEDLKWPCRKKKLLWEGKKNPPQTGLLLIAGTIIKFAIGNLFKDYFSSDFFALCKSNFKGMPSFQTSTNIYVCSHEQPLNFYFSNKDNCRKQFQILIGLFKKQINIPRRDLQPTAAGPRWRVGAGKACFSGHTEAQKWTNPVLGCSSREGEKQTKCTALKIRWGF